MEQKLSDTLVKVVDRSNPLMQNLQLAARFNKLIDESGADLEDNKAATIDVSAYTDPVEVTPTEGKDGMKKATITLSNIPQAGATLYAWYDDTDGAIIYTKVEVPTTSDKALVGTSTGLVEVSISAVTESSITVNGVEWVRQPDEDIEL